MSISCPWLSFPHLNFDLFKGVSVVICEQNCPLKSRIDLVSQLAQYVHHVILLNQISLPHKLQDSHVPIVDEILHTDDRAMLPVVHKTWQFIFSQLLHVEFLREVIEHYEWNVDYLTNLVLTLLALSLQALLVLVPSRLLPLCRLFCGLIHLLVPLDEPLGLQDVLDLVRCIS